MLASWSVIENRATGRRDRRPAPAVDSVIDPAAATVSMGWTTYLQQRLIAVRLFDGLLIEECYCSSLNTIPICRRISSTSRIVARDSSSDRSGDSSRPPEMHLATSAAS